MAERENPLQPMIDAHAGQMKDVPIAHYECEFAAADPEAMARRSGVRYEADECGGTETDAGTSADGMSEAGETADGEVASGGSGSFHLRMLGRGITVAWPSMEATYDDTGEPVGHSGRILIADLLLRRQLVPSTGGFVSYKEVPWGDHYFKAFEGRCLKRLAYMFQTTDAFETAAEAAGGKRVMGGGGATYEFDFLDGVLVRLTFWEADDEFPPASQILFSDNAPLAFTAEDLAAVGDIVLTTLKSHRQ